MDILEGGTPGSAWPRDCGLATKGQYCCLAAWTLDCSLLSIPAVNSISDFLHCFSCFLKHPLLPFLILLHRLLGWYKEVEPKCAMSATCFCPPLSTLRPFHLTFLRSPQGQSLCSSPSEGMQYCRPSAYWPDSIDIFCVMYSIILLLMTDKIYWIFFIFVTFHIYT